jgi:hypothetical protein
MSFSPQSKRITDPGKAAIKYLSVYALVMSIATIVPTVGRSAEAVSAITTGEGISRTGARASSAARILNMKTNADAASITRGIRPSILGYHDSIDPQAGTAQKLLEKFLAFIMSATNDNIGISDASSAPHTGMSMDRRLVILTNSPTPKGQTKSTA